MRYTKEVRAALIKVQHGFAELIRALDAQAQGVVASEPAGTPTPERVTTKAPAPRQTVAAPVETEPRGALSEKTRAESLPAAIAVATKMAKVIGPDNIEFVPGLRGQLALQRIPHDEELIQAAVAATRGIQP